MAENEKPITYLKLYESIQEINKRVDILVPLIKEILGENYTYDEIEEYSSVGITLKETTYCGRGCCGPEVSHYYLPEEWLNTDNEEELRWILLDEKLRRDRLKAEEDEKKRLEYEAEQIRLAKEKKDKEKREFERLKAIYEPEKEQS